MLTLALIMGAVGISVAAIMLSSPGRCMGGDSLEYLGLARGIAEHGSFRSLANDSSPELYRTPAYPVFLALAQPWKSLDRFRITLLVQLLLVWLSVVLVAHALIRLRIASPLGSLAAAGLVVLNPMVLILSMQFLTEALFLCACCLAMSALARALDRGRLMFAALSGTALGTAVMIRPIGLVIVVAIAAALLIAKGFPRWRRIRPALPPMGWTLPIVWVLAASAMPLGWSIRNGLVGDYWGVSKTGPSFVRSTYSALYPTQGHRAIRDTSFDLDGRPMAFLSGLARTAFGPGEWTMRSALLGDKGSRPDSGPSRVFEVVSRPNEVAIISSQALPPTQPASHSAEALLLIAWSAAITTLTYLFVAIGLLRRPFAVHWILAIALLAAAALLVSSSGYQAYARFRVPMTPFLAVGAAFGISRLTGWRTRRAAPSLSSGIEMNDTAAR